LLLRGGARITARADAKTKSRVGDSITVAFNDNKIHLFDKDTGYAI